MRTSTKRAGRLGCGFCARQRRLDFQNSLAFTITDFHGSLHRDTILRHITRSHKKRDYHVDESRLNGGLGLSLIFGLRASFLFVSTFPHPEKE